MKRTGKSKKDEVWLKKLGERIDSLIREKGYASPYDFWVQRAGDKVSRAALNYIHTGKTDHKATTLKAPADHLQVRVRDFPTSPLSRMSGRDFLRGNLKENGARGEWAD